MGFIKAALSAGISSFQDSKFKEAITLPEAVPATVLAIKGQLLTKIQMGALARATKIQVY